MWINTLRPTERVKGIWMLMISNEIPIRRSRILRSTGMASVFPANAIVLTNFFGGPSPTRTAGRLRFDCIRTRADSPTLQYGEPVERLPGCRVVCGNLSFDGFIGAWYRLPSRFEFANASYRRLHLSMADFQARRLSWRDIDLASRDPAHAAAQAAWTVLHTNDRASIRPLPAVGIASRHTRLQVP